MYQRAGLHLAEPATADRAAGSPLNTARYLCDGPHARKSGVAALTADLHVRRTSILRFGASACLALYLSLVGVPVLHALETTPQTIESHVHGEEACAPQHDELHCPTCNVAPPAKAPASGGPGLIFTGRHTGPARARSDEEAPSLA